MCAEKSPSLFFIERIVLPSKREFRMEKSEMLLQRLPNLPWRIFHTETFVSVEVEVKKEEKEIFFSK